MTIADDGLLRDFQAALAGRYALERELGRGGMGVVYLAHDPRLDRSVAIKLLPPLLGAQPEVRDRLLREARMAAGLSHPHIVPVHAVEETGRFAYFVMAYVEGETLGERVRRRGPLPPLEAARMLREVGWALAYAHARGIVHRDVKPENILLEAATGRALVTDFGIARLLAGSAALPGGEVLGTPEFMSPEQAAGEPVDGRGDLYSLGVVGYFALTAAPPFHGARTLEVLGQLLARAPAPLRQVAPQVPQAIATAVERCLAKDPSGRFASGESFVEAVDGALVAARRPPLAVRMFISEGKDRSATRLLRSLLATSVALPAGLWALVWATFRGEPPREFALAVGGLGLLLLLLAVAAPLERVVERARRLLEAGHGRDELIRALEADLAERREELALLYGTSASRLERGARAATFGALGLMAGAGALAFVVGYPLVLAVFSLFGVAVATAVVGLIVAREAAGRRAHAAEARRLRFWRGALGRGLFRLAAFGAEPPTSGPRRA